MKKYPLLNIHGRPITRRDFVSRGLMAGGATFLMPTLGKLWRSEAHAAQSNYFAGAAQSNQSNFPFVVFDLAGGAALPANFLVGKLGGPKDLLRSYNLLGWNPKTNKMDERFGLPMAGENISGILTGLLEVTTPEAQKNFRFASFLHTGQIDTSANPLSALSLVAHSGSKGLDISSPVGLRNSLSGGNSKYAFESANYKAMAVTKLDDLLNAVGLGGALGGIPDPSKVVLGRIVKRLSMMQATRLLSASADDELLKNLGVQYESVANKVAASSGLDPRQDAVFSELYAINRDSSPLSESVLRAAVMMGVLKGVTGPGVLTIDGCDYHDGTQTTGDQKDLEIGREIGRSIQAAHLLNRPLFLQIITDGGIYPQENSRVWTGDTVDTCMSVIGCYLPEGPVSYHEGRMQVGSYTDGQGADRTSIIGDSPQLAAYAAFANYLNINGRLKDFQSLAPGIFSEQALQSVLVFQG